MKKIVFLVFLFLSSLTYANHQINDYNRLFLPVYNQSGELKIAIRAFKQDGIPSFLIVNPQTLKTQVVAMTAMLPRNPPAKKNPGYFTHWYVTSTRYYQLLNKMTAPPYPLENQGLKHADKLAEGNILSIDLCPSTRPIEKAFFQRLIDASKSTKQATPITISISGLWIIQHHKEYQWLLQAQKNNQLAITWANHSFSHVFYRDLPYANNFLLSPESNFDYEILATEKLLLESGQTPSIYFRFPGLVSDKNLIKKLKLYGLIPLGADAWLAKHQPITPGGIILVHGNSNEHQGIVAILPLIKQLNLKPINQFV